MTDKSAIVTGAARGIGLATTRLLLGQGWRVAMVDRDAPALAQAAEGLAGAVPVLADISIPDQVDRMIAASVAALGGIDALVNNAGVAAFGPIGQTSFEIWREVMATNLDGVFLCTQAATAELAKRRGAVVKSPRYPGCGQVPCGSPTALRKRQ